jgi:hypothetical protein
VGGTHMGLGMEAISTGLRMGAIRMGVGGEAIDKNLRNELTIWFWEWKLSTRVSELSCQYGSGSGSYKHGFHSRSCQQES